MSFTTIISPEELHERLGDPELVIFDCRHSLADFALGRRLYDESHVPGAFFAAVEEDLAGTKTGKNGRHPLPDPETFARFLGACGVNDATQIVAYDAGADMFAPRLWFLSPLDRSRRRRNSRRRLHALERTRISRDGRLRAAGHVTERSTIRLRPGLLVDAQYVLAHLDAAEMQLLDARAKERYTGETEPIDPVAGHIPGARQSLVQRKLRTRRQAQITRRAARRVRTSRPRSKPDRASMRLRRLLSGQSTRDAARRPRRLAHLQRIVERMGLRSLTPDRNGALMLYRARTGLADARHRSLCPLSDIWPSVPKSTLACSFRQPLRGWRDGERFCDCARGRSFDAPRRGSRASSSGVGDCEKSRHVSTKQ